MPLKIGSCKYDIQQLMDLQAQDPKFDCEKYYPGNGCSLPILPGHYGAEFHGDDAIPIKIPEDLVVPDKFKSLLEGKYNIHYSVSAYGSEIVCTDTEIEIKF